MDGCYYQLLLSEQRLTIDYKFGLCEHTARVGGDTLTFAKVCWSEEKEGEEGGVNGRLSIRGISLLHTPQHLSINSTHT